MPIQIWCIYPYLEKHNRTDAYDCRHSERDLMVSPGSTRFGLSVRSTDLGSVGYTVHNPKTTIFALAGDTGNTAVPKDHQEFDREFPPAL